MRITLLSFLAAAALAGQASAADLLYTPASGQVQLRPDTKIVSFALVDNEGGFLNVNSIVFPDSSTFVTRQPDEIGWTDMNGIAGAGFVSTYTLGNVFPKNLTAATLPSFLDDATFSRGTVGGIGSGGSFNLVVVPEPTSLSLLGLGGIALLRRRGR